MTFAADHLNYRLYHHVLREGVAQEVADRNRLSPKLGFLGKYKSAMRLTRSLRHDKAIIFRQSGVQQWYQVPDETSQRNTRLPESY